MVEEEDKGEFRRDPEGKGRIFMVMITVAIGATVVSTRGWRVGVEMGEEEKKDL